jgi:hypothetical protein
MIIASCPVVSILVWPAKVRSSNLELGRTKRWKDKLVVWLVYVESDEGWVFNVYGNSFSRQAGECRESAFSVFIFGRLSQKVPRLCERREWYGVLAYVFLRINHPHIAVGCVVFGRRGIVIWCLSPRRLVLWSKSRELWSNEYARWDCEWCRAGVGNPRHACQAWHVERFSMARWVNLNTVIMIS